jgi:hypothetical protein
MQRPHRLLLFRSNTDWSGINLRTGLKAPLGSPTINLFGSGPSGTDYNCVPGTGLTVLKARYAAVQIVGVGAFDLRRDDLADAQRTPAGDIDRAIDLRRVRLRTAL